VRLIPNQAKVSQRREWAMAQQDGASTKRHHTQWAAQFFVAGELCKRGYDVAFTMGNATPEADLMVSLPGGSMFLVDVKGQRTKNFWRITPKPARDNLYYVLSYVPATNEYPRFFVLSQKTLSKLMIEYEHSGIKFDPRFSGINWTTPAPHEDKWDILPQ
jgi:hypothetical protein